MTATVCTAPSPVICRAQYDLPDSRYRSADGRGAPPGRTIFQTTEFKGRLFMSVELDAIDHKILDEWMS
jgi:hypothetical protein